MPHIFKVFSISSALVRIKSDQVCNSLISWSRFKFPFYSRYVIRPGDHCHCLSLRISPTRFCLDDVCPKHRGLFGSPTKATWSVWEGNPPPLYRPFFCRKSKVQRRGYPIPFFMDWTQDNILQVYGRLSKWPLDKLWLLERLGNLFVVYILTIDL